MKELKFWKLSFEVHVDPFKPRRASSSAKTNRTR